MAFKRENIPNSTDNVTGATYSPGNSKDVLNKHLQDETTDIKNVGEEYTEEQKVASGKFHSGARVPADMTVKLVRADSSVTEIIVTSIYTFTMTFAGIFVGAWITACTNEQDVHWAIVLSTIVLFIISAGLIIWYVSLKRKQSNDSILLPSSTFEEYK